MVHIKNLSQDKSLKSYYPDIRRYFKKTLEVLGIAECPEVSLIIVDEEKIHVQKDWINAADLITDEIIRETDKIFVLYDVATMHLVKKIRGDLTAKLKGGKKK